MLSLLLALFLPISDLQQLDNPNFRIREKADRHIRARIKCPIAAHLLTRWSPPSPEAAYRVRHMLEDRRAIPNGWDDLPTIDMLWWTPGKASNEFGAIKWWGMANNIEGPAFLDGRRNYGSMRFATWLMINEMYDDFYPKWVIRALLQLMWDREKEWDNRFNRRPNSYKYPRAAELIK